MHVVDALHNKSQQPASDGNLCSLCSGVEDFYSCDSLLDFSVLCN